MSLSSLHGGASGTAFSQILREECGWPVLVAATWFNVHAAQAWYAAATRKPLRRFTGSPFGKDRLPLHLDWHNGRNKSGRQDNTPATLNHRCKDFNSGIHRAHIEMVNTATMSPFEFQCGYYYGHA